MGLFGKKKDQAKNPEKKPKDDARKFNDEGNGAFLKGDLDEALQKYQAAIVLDEKEGDLWGKSANLSNIGIIYISKGEIKLAIESLQASHEILKELGLHKERAIPVKPFKNLTVEGIILPFKNLTQAERG